MATNPQPEPQPNKLTIQGVAQRAGFMVSTIRKWQRDGKVPPAPTDGNYSPEYVEILQTYRKNALSAQSKNRWAKLTRKERTEVAKKQWTEERKKTQSITMRNVRLGLTGLTPKELEEWNTNSKNAADTPEVRQAKARGAGDLWAERNKKLAAAWRPDDWWDKPEHWRIIGSMLLDQDHISNKDLAQRLDDAAITKCPYGTTWVESIEDNACKKLIQKVRKWVGRPGKTGASIPLAAVS